jgi:hypothetical protein
MFLNFIDSPVFVNVIVAAAAATVVVKIVVVVVKFYVRQELNACMC